MCYFGLNTRRTEIASGTGLDLGCLQAAAESILVMLKRDSKN